MSSIRGAVRKAPPARKEPDSHKANSGGSGFNSRARQKSRCGSQHMSEERKEAHRTARALQKAARKLAARQAVQPPPENQAAD